MPRHELGNDVLGGNLGTYTVYHVLDKYSYIRRRQQ